MRIHTRQTVLTVSLMNSEEKEVSRSLIIGDQYTTSDILIGRDVRTGESFSFDV